MKLAPICINNYLNYIYAVDIEGPKLCAVVEETTDDKFRRRM